MAAIVLRSAMMSSPLPGDDEQFYLLVGDRMLTGAVPYVDIWDRKPWGLFALMAAVRSLGGPPYVVMNLFALASAAGSAMMVSALAARRTGTVAATLAGCFYLLMLGMLGGETFQTAVFYNLATAAAALLLVRTAPALEGPGDLPRAMMAMLLLGIAIQVKTTAAIEGSAIGLWLLTRMWSRTGWQTLVWRCLLFAGLGLAPTLLVAIGYWKAGHLDAWWFANVQSQTLKSGGYGPDSLSRLPGYLALMAPPAAAALIGWVRMPGSTERSLLTWWTAATVVDAFVIGNFWVLYLLPFALPASILAAQAFAIPRKGNWLFALFSLWPAVREIGTDRYFVAQSHKVAAATVAAIPADVQRECLLAYNAPMTYYLLTRACLVTPYIFVDHLRSAAEAAALPVDASNALRSALARRPGTILSVERSRWRLPNRANDAILAAALRQNYRAVRRLPMIFWPVDSETVVVWRRRDLPAQ